MLAFAKFWQTESILTVFTNEISFISRRSFAYTTQCVIALHGLLCSLHLNDRSTCHYPSSSGTDEAKNKSESYI